MGYLPNTTLATAVPITLPCKIILNQQQFDPASKWLFYRFTVGPRDTLVGMTFDSDPNVDGGVQVLNADGTEHVLGLYVDTRDAGQQIVQPGQTYYFRVDPGNGRPGDPPWVHDIVFEAKVFPTQYAPAGSILVNDDENGFPGMIFGFDGTFYRAPYMVGGENGDVLATGEILLDSDTDDSYAPEPADFFYLYDKDFNLIASCSPFFAGAEHYQCAVAIDFVDHFYVKWFMGAGGAVNHQVKRISRTGVVDPMTWVLPTNQSSAIAVSPGGALLYYSAFMTKSIETFDLVNNVPGPQFLPDQTGYGAGDMVMLYDGTLLINYDKIPDPGHRLLDHVRHYAPDGTLLHTIWNGDIASPAWFIDHICRDGLSTTTYIHWNESSGSDDGVQESVWSRVRISDSKVLAQVRAPFSESGRLSEGARPWAPSGSCPMLVLTHPSDCGPTSPPRLPTKWGG